MEFEELCSYGEEYEDGACWWSILYKGSINIDNKDYFFIVNRRISPESKFSSRGDTYLTYRDTTSVKEVTDSEERLEELIADYDKKKEFWKNNRMSAKVKEQLDIPDVVASDLTTTQIIFPILAYMNKDNTQVFSEICTSLLEEKQKQMYLNREPLLSDFITEDLDVEKIMEDYSQKTGFVFSKEHIDLALKYKEMMIDCVLDGMYNGKDYQTFINLLPEVVLRKKVFVNKNIGSGLIQSTKQKRVLRKIHSDNPSKDYYCITPQECPSQPKSFMSYRKFSSIMHSINYRPNSYRAELGACDVLTKEEFIKNHPNCSRYSSNYDFYADTGINNLGHIYMGVSYDEEGLFQIHGGTVINVNPINFYEER